jgi:hypothetical protein
MSAFMLADETINCVVYWLFREVTKSHWLKEQVENTLKIETTQPDWEEALGKDMFQLNIDGVNDRYGQGEAKNFRDLDYQYTPVFGSKIEVLKSLQCWLYQCMEGEVVKKPLYKFFDTVIEHHLMASIIYDLPEYNSAAWGK